MQIFNSISLILAIYGAIVSTILGINQILSYSKRLKIIIQYNAFYENMFLIIANISRRPITIMGLSANTSGGGPVPLNSMFRDDECLGEIFPFTIKPFETRNLKIHEFFSFDNETLSLTVYDIEGKAYSKFKKQIFNAKWGFVEKSTPPSN